MCCGGRDGMRFAIKASQKIKNGVVGREGSFLEKKTHLYGEYETLQNRCVCNFITVQWVYIYRYIKKNIGAVIRVYHIGQNLQNNECYLLYFFPKMYISY